MATSKEPPKYTTVGSIANTNTMPLHPPARRGRIVKWSMQTEFGLITSPVPDLCYGPGRRSPPPMDNQPVHYSPLQQNMDRAVSPTMDHSSLTAPNVPLTTILSPTATPLENYDDIIATSQNVDGDAEDLDYSSMKQLTVKALTNLASYENPNQKTAQRMLFRARSTPLQPLQSYFKQPSVASMLQSDGTSDHRNKPATYSSVLSKGPGAPQPLQAGPPGLRQHKSCTFEPMTDKKYTEAVNDGFMTVRQSTSSAAFMEMSCPTLRNIVSITTYPTASIQESLDTDYCTSRIVDTLCPERARMYYHKGLLPANFNYQIQPSPEVNDYGSGIDRQTNWIRNNETNIAHNAMIDAFWSEGMGMLGKSIHTAASEHEHQLLESLMSIKPDHTKVKRKAMLPKLSVEMANLIPAEEHAAPLLSMAFQTLVSSEIFTLSGHLPKLEYREI